MVSTCIYTDGACLGNPGPGGWAFVVFSDGKEKYACSEGVMETTNNRMELYAAIMACEYALLARTYTPTVSGNTGDDKIDENQVLILTDSRYVQQGITLWCPSWIKNNWRGSKGPIKNLDLWQRLHAVCGQNHVRWEWVRGHNGNMGNERADMLASAEAQKMKQQTKDTKPSTLTQKEKTNDEKIYLNVPFADKDDAKTKGARWDPSQKKWFVTSPNHQCHKWLPKR